MGNEWVAANSGLTDQTWDLSFPSNKKKLDEGNKKISIEISVTWIWFVLLLNTFKTFGYFMQGCNRTQVCQGE